MDVHQNVYGMHKFKKKNIHVKMKFAQACAWPKLFVSLNVAIS